METMGATHSEMDINIFQYFLLSTIFLFIITIESSLVTKKFVDLHNLVFQKKIIN